MLKDCHWDPEAVLAQHAVSESQLEAWLVNPLARALFDSDVQEGGSTTVTEVREVNEVPEVVLA